MAPITIPTQLQMKALRGLDDADAIAILDSHGVAHGPGDSPDSLRAKVRANLSAGRIPAAALDNYPPKPQAPAKLSELGFTAAHREALAKHQPDPTVHIAGFATTLKSPVLAEMMRNLRAAESGSGA